jgi:hypothetical protein
MEEAIIESILELLPDYCTEEEKLGSITKIIDLLEKEVNNLIKVNPREVFIVEDLTRNKLLEEDFITGVTNAQELRRIVIRGVDQEGKYRVLKIKHEVDADSMKAGRVGANVMGSWYIFPGDIQLSALIIACDTIPIMNIEI